MTTTIAVRRRNVRSAGAVAVRAPETVLAVVVAAVVTWEWWLWTGPFAEGQSTAPAWWYLPPAAVTLAGLLAARRRTESLRPATVVVLGVLLALGFLAVHLAVGGPRDQDVLELYPRYGAELLATGELPPAEYPPLALLSFAAAVALGPVPVTLPLLTLPVLAGAWWAVARSGPDGAWWAACAALLSTLVPFWEVKYDALPAALLALGMVAARRECWGWAGLALGLGAAAKWYPGLAVPVLALALVRLGRARAPGDASTDQCIRGTEATDRPIRGSVAGRRAPPPAPRGRGRARAAAVLCAAAAGGFALPHLPFVADPEGLLAPYAFHAGRGITGESLPYLFLRPLGLADVPGRPWFEAAVPPWAPPVALAVLAVVLVGLAGAAAWRPAWALPLAAAAPIAFLLGNRIFSPQFLLPVVLAAAGVAAGDTGGAGGVSSRKRRRRTCGFAVLAVTAATANYAVWPTASPAWYPLQMVLFATLTAAVVVALRPGSPAGRPVSAGAERG